MALYVQAAVEAKDTQLQRQGIELQERDAQINGQQQELQTLRVYILLTAVVE